MFPPRKACLAAVLAIGALATGPAGADNFVRIPVTLKDHQFSPSEIDVPSGFPIILTIKNEDPTPEEFDSVDLRVEKVIPGGAYGTVQVRPLGPGTYNFIGEYNAATAVGVVISNGQLPPPNR